MTRQITLTPPAGVFAAVQVELEDGTIVGAETCLNPDSTPKTQIAASVKTASNDLVLRWVHENSDLEPIVMRYGTHAGRLR